MNYSELIDYHRADRKVKPCLVVKMTIDVHSHLLTREFYPESFWEWYVQLQASRRPPAVSLEEALTKARRSIVPAYWAADGTWHIERMDAAGIEKTILLHMDQELLFGQREGGPTIEQQNRYVSEVAKKYPDRFVYFCGVDPRRPGAVGLLEKCVDQWGARGIKLYPTTGFLPADRAVYPFYERAVAWKLPVYFHMGPENPPYKNEGNAHPSLLLRVLVDFPELTVIVAHLSYEFWRDLLALGRVRENIRCDIAGWQRIARQNYGQFCYVLRRFLDEFGRERVMFGTDAPLVEHPVSSQEYVEIVKRLPQESPAEYHFTQQEVSALLDGNARRLLASLPEL